MHIWENTLLIPPGRQKTASLNEQPVFCHREAIIALCVTLVPCIELRLKLFRVRFRPEEDNVIQHRGIYFESDSNPFVTSGAMMQVSKKYRQLKFEINDQRDHYETVLLRFKLNRHEVTGLLNGSITDWIFQSDSSAFLKIVPSGKLCKYALWYDSVPKQLNKIYKGVWEAALKAGYDLSDKE